MKHLNWKRLCVCLILFGLLFSAIGCGKAASPREMRDEAGPIGYGSDVKNGSYASKTDAAAADGYRDGVEYGEAAPASSEGAAEGLDIEAEYGKDDVRDDITGHQITASALNDHEAFEDWLLLFERRQDEEIPHFTEDLLGGSFWGLDSRIRLKIKVTNGTDPLYGAVVSCTGAGGKIFTARTDASGVAYLFPETYDGTYTVDLDGRTKEGTFSRQTLEQSVVLEGAAAKKSARIQVMFVVDVTGSMSDELIFLQKEVDNVLTRVRKDNGNVPLEVSFLFYRDDGDREKFAFVPFADISSSAAYASARNVLNNQMADGGGDYPEAFDEALLMAVKDSGWKEDRTTRLIFHIFDAPPHTNSWEQDKYEQRLEQAVRKAAELGIRYCPILASGADLLCEYLGRQGAVYTGGTSVFITDDSGIGGGHLDPDAKPMTVEYLDDLLVRLIDGYYTGVFAQAVPIDSDQKN